MHWPISNGGASRHFQNFPYFSNAGRYEVRGGCVSKSNTSCAERMTAGSVSGLQCFAPMRLPVQSLFKACSDFKRQDHGETAPSARRIGLGYGCSRLRLCGSMAFPQRPLPTWPNRSCFCRDAFESEPRSAERLPGLTATYLSDDRSFRGRSVSGFCCTISCQYTRNVPLKRMIVSKAWRCAISHCFWAIPLGRFPQEVANPLFRQ